MFDIINDADLKACLEFIVKADALKKVLRKTHVIKNARPENTAEHSWHLALMAITLSRYANAPLKLERVIKMLILHDIGEIEDGDVFLYDASRTQARDAERLAVERLFADLPSDLRQEFTELWVEFAEGNSPEACFARAMDRFQPFLSNLANDGDTWISMQITKEQAFAKNKHINEGSTLLWETYQKLAHQADGRGLFHPDKRTA